jgi:hypothetical protein
MSVQDTVKRKVSIDGKDSVGLFIRNHFLRFIYSGFLHCFPFEKNAEFWKRVPLLKNGVKVSEIEKIAMVWDENKYTPYDYHFAVLNEFERFLVENGIEAIPFIRKSMLDLGRGLPFEPKIFLWIMEPCITAFIKSQDIRTEFLKRLHLFNNRSHPGTIQKLISLRSKDNFHEGVIVFSPKKNNCTKFPKTDGELFFAITMQQSIVRFGLQPFDRYKMYSETQTVFERVTDENHSSITDGIFSINDKKHGQVIRFSEFLLQNDISLKNHIHFEDCPVVKIIEDWYCPTRKRVVLHAGCAYGAPVVIYSMIYKKTKGAKALFSDFVNDIAYGPSGEWKKIECLHRQFLWYLSGKSLILYDSKSGYIIFNNTYLMHGVPAKILRKILVDYIDKGKKHFEHKEFVTIDDFVSHPKNTGFETRLKRLIRKIEKTDLPFRIVKSDKGCFDLECRCKLEFMEK